MPMPSVPVSIMIEKQVKEKIQGKTISGATYEKYYEGKYPWHSFDNIEKIVNAEIIYADSNFIYTSNGMLVEYGYNHGDLRYFDSVDDINVKPLKKSVSDGYVVKIIFTDNSCLTITLYGWSTRFSVKEQNIYGSIIPKSPIEVTDEKDFTLENFKKWLSKNSNQNIIENCSTVKGAFDIYNPVMSFILLISKIHPRTKTRDLSDSKIENLYYNILSIIKEYQSGERICQHTDIFGNKVKAKNDIVWMDSQILRKPCPVCGVSIDCVPCAGTKMYFCPQCQIKK